MDAPLTCGSRIKGIINMAGMKSFLSIKTVSCVAFATILAGPAGAAPKSPHAHPRPLEIADPSYPPQPAFFVIKDNDSILYVLGSQHKVRTHTKWLTPQVRDAFFEADRIWFEITDEDSSHPILQIKSMRQGEAESGDTLSKVLTQEEYARVTAAANSIGVEMSTLDQLKPWLVGDILMGTFQAKIDEKKYDDGSPVKDIRNDQKDKSAGTAKKRPAAMQGGVEDMLSLMDVGRPMKSIENVENHIMLFEKLPDDVQRKYLMVAIDELEDKTDEMKALSKAWRRGDLATLGETDVAKMKTDNEAFYDAMLKSRNVEMTDRADEILKGSGVDFFVVGAAHLAGPDSVLEMLKARGHRPIRLFDTKPPVAMKDPGRGPDMPLYHVVPEPMPKLQVQLLPPVAGQIDTARLRLMADYMTNGCGEYLPLLYKIRKDGNIFEIQTAGGTLFVNPPQNRDTCGPASKVSYVDIPINARDLRENNVSTLWLMRGGGIDKFSVDVTDKTLSITPPERLKFFKTKTHGEMTVTLATATKDP
jgi:uncharacterized protein